MVANLGLEEWCPGHYLRGAWCDAFSTTVSKGFEEEILRFLVRKIPQAKNLSQILT